VTDRSGGQATSLQPKSFRSVWRRAFDFRRGGRSTARLTLVQGGLTASVLAALLFFGVLEGFELKILDTQFELRGTRAPETPIVIVSIDEDSFDELNEPWPWPRSLHGQLIERLSADRPAAIGLDILFPEPSGRGPEDDAAFARALGAAGNVVLAGVRTEVQQTFIERQDLNRPVDVLLDQAAGVGVVNLVHDQDAFVRRAPLGMPHGSLTVPSFATALRDRAQAAGVPAAPLPNAAWLHIDYAGGPRTFPTVPYYQVVRREIAPGTFRGKIVLVGATSAALHDVFPTPFAPFGMPGVEIHANVLETLLRGIPIVRVPRWAAAAMALVAAFLGAGVANRARPLLSLPAVLIAMAAFAGTAFAAFAWGRYWIDQTPVPLGLGLGYVAATFNHVVRARREKLRLSRFFSPSVLRQITNDRAEPDRSRRVVSILFSDIRGFTPIAERLSPEAVAEFLGDHMTTMTDAVFAHGGIVVQFVGDEIMALFNAPFDQPDHELQAVRTGLALQQRVREVSDRWIARCGSPVRIGVGIHTGEAGSAQRVEYGAIGDTINLASRLQGLTKEFTAPLIISETTYQAVREHVACRMLGDVAVRGKAMPVRIYAVEREGPVRAPRVAVERPLTLTEGAGDSRLAVLCTMSDLSATGLRASDLPKPFEVGHVVGVTFEHPDRPETISASGEIVWSRDGSVGIKFLRLTAADAAVIGEIVRTLEQADLKS
jgi:adenylate cyclase